MRGAREINKNLWAVTKAHKVYETFSIFESRAQAEASAKRMIENWGDEDTTYVVKKHRIRKIKKW